LSAFSDTLDGRLRGKLDAGRNALLGLDRDCNIHRSNKQYV